jgi:hypothetical protein
VCLLDTGSPRTILHIAVLEAAGIPLSDAANVTDFNVCGDRTAYEFPMDLQDVNDDEDSRYDLPTTPVLFVDGPQLPVTGIVGGDVLGEFVTVFRERERLFHLRPLADLLHRDCPHTNGAFPL